MVFSFGRFNAFRAFLFCFPCPGITRTPLRAFRPLYARPSACIFRFMVPRSKLPIPDDALAVVEGDLTRMCVSGVAMCSACGSHDQLSVVLCLSDFDGYAGLCCACGAVSRVLIPEPYGLPYRRLAALAVDSWNEQQGVALPVSFGLSDEAVAKCFSFVGAVVRADISIPADGLSPP